MGVGRRRENAGRKLGAIGVAKNPALKKKEGSETLLTIEN